jgi:hypothetical protein
MNNYEENSKFENFEEEIDLLKLEKMQISKEEEIKKINLLKIKHLEKLLEEKTKKLEISEENFKSLKEKFEININLIEERDNDIAIYNSKFDKLYLVIKEKENYIKNLEEKIVNLNSNLNVIKGKKDTSDETYKYKINQLNSSFKEESK